MSVYLAVCLSSERMHYIAVVIGCMLFVTVVLLQYIKNESTFSANAMVRCM